MNRPLAAILPILMATSALGGERILAVHSDAAGNVRVLTDQAGNVVERHDYLPFGEEWCGNSVCVAVAPGQPRRFTGKERDAETGLDYFGARYFRPNIGRFTSVDPAVNQKAAFFEPQRWHRYAYVWNNPLRFIDPDGREGAELAQNRDIQALLSGRMSIEEYNDRAAARAAGAAVGLATVGAVMAPQLLPVLITKAADPANQAAVHEALEGLAGGPPISPSVAPAAYSARLLPHVQTIQGILKGQVPRSELSRELLEEAAKHYEGAAGTTVGAFKEVAKEYNLARARYLRDGGEAPGRTIYEFAEKRGISLPGGTQ
jgi:RHS repeat-associated protein